MSASPQPRPLRVCVTGAECTGKTTLSSALADVLSAPVIHESVRAYFAEKALTGDATLYASDLVRVVDIQVATEDVAPTDVALVIFDTDLFTIEIWQVRYFGDRFSELEQLANERQHDESHKIDLYVLCAPDIPFVHDGVRGSDAERTRMHEVFRERLLRDERTFVEVSGTVHERCEKALAAIMGLAVAQGREAIEATSC